MIKSTQTLHFRTICRLKMEICYISLSSDSTRAVKFESFDMRKSFKICLKFTSSQDKNHSISRWKRRSAGTTTYCIIPDQFAFDFICRTFLNHVEFCVKIFIFCRKQKMCEKYLRWIIRILPSTNLSERHANGYNYSILKYLLWKVGIWVLLLFLENVLTGRASIVTYRSVN